MNYRTEFLQKAVILLLVSLMAGCQTEPEKTSSSLENTEQTAVQSETQTASVRKSDESTEEKTMKIRIGNSVFEIEPADTKAARELMEKLEEGPVELKLHAYGGFEKTGPLHFSLTTEDRQVRTEPGDLMLYQGDQISLFYGENSWSYTPLGSVKDLSGWTDALKNGPDEMTLLR